VVSVGQRFRSGGAIADSGWVQAELRAQVGADWASVLTVALKMALGGQAGRDEVAWDDLRAGLRRCAAPVAVWTYGAAGHHQYADVGHRSAVPPKPPQPSRQEIREFFAQARMIEFTTYTTPTPMAEHMVRFWRFLLPDVAAES
jgi:hypothetical protein